MIQVTQEQKERSVKAIQQANSKEYQHQAASHALVNKVLDDIMQDPYWLELAKEIMQAKEANNE